MLSLLLFVCFIAVGGVLLDRNIFGAVLITIGAFGIGACVVLGLLWTDISVDHCVKYAQTKELISTYQSSPFLTKKDIDLVYNLITEHNAWVAKKQQLDDSIVTGWITRNSITVNPLFDIDKTMEMLNKKQLTK